MRIGEASRLEWTDLNLQNNTITLNEPEKHGKARMFKASVKLIGMLQALPKKNEGIFGHGRVRDKEHTFQMQRQKRALVRSGFRFNLEFVCFIKKGDLWRRTRQLLAPAYLDWACFVEQCPIVAWQVMQVWKLPAVFRMKRQKVCGDKRRATRVSPASPHSHEGIS